MNISDYLRTALVNHALGVAVYTPPTTIWTALYTTAPTSAGGGVEVVASDYHRISTTWNPAALGATSNTSDIRFPAASVTQSNWGVVLAAGLFDAPTGGNLMFFGPLSSGVQLSLGAEFDIAPSNLTITLS